MLRLVDPNPESPDTPNAGPDLGPGEASVVLSTQRRADLVAAFGWDELPVAAEPDAARFGGAHAVDVPRRGGGQCIGPNDLVDGRLLMTIGRDVKGASSTRGSRRATPGR